MSLAHRIHARLASRSGGSFAAAAALCSLLGALPAPSAAADGASATPQYTGDIIVRWRDTQQPAAAPLRQLAQKTGLGLTVKRPMSGNAELVAVTGGGAADPEAVAAQLRQDPRVADAIPDRWLHLHDTVPNDPLFPNQPYLAGPSSVPGGANLPAAWDRSRGAPSLVIAVVDTGVLRHGDLAARLVNGYDFISDPQYSLDGDGREADPTDAGDNMPTGYTCPGSPPAPADQPNSWHGTRVAGVLGAVTDNGAGIAAVDWQARILPVRVSGRCGAQLSDTIDGMRWAGGLPVPGVPDNPTPARVINISLGGGACSSFEQQAVDELAARGVVVVAAAGNSGGAVEAPANCRGVVGVTAHVNDGENASYASVGPEVALSAPGGGCGNSRVANGVCQTPVSTILTLSNTGTTSAGSDTVVPSQGTSFAAPMVSGVASLMLAVNGALSPAQIGELLRSTARPHPANTYCTSAGNTGKCGAGLLDANGAVAAATGATPAPQPAPTPTPTPPADDGGGGAVPPEGALALALAGWLALWLPRRHARLRRLRRQH